MGRADRNRAASVPSTAAAARHQQANRTKPSYKVVFEEFAQEKRLRKYTTLSSTPPRGYTFIPAGDPQLTNSCKKVSKELDMTVYIVSGGSRSVKLSKEIHRLGYHFSTFAVEKACQELGVTLNAAGRVSQSQFALLHDDPKDLRKPQRKGNNARARRQIAGYQNALPQWMIDSQARQAIKDLFPKIPDRDLNEVVFRAFDKEAKLIGTADGLSLARRANLAVGAHIRHTYTNYDELLKSNVAWQDARRGVERFTLDKLVSWRGDEDDDDPIIEEVLREVVVLSDAEDDDDANLEDILPPRELQEAAIDLTGDDDDDDGDGDESEKIPDVYQGASQFQQRQNTQDAARAARQGHQRHARWAEALHRRQQNPMPADTRGMPPSDNVGESRHFTRPQREQLPKMIHGLDINNGSVIRPEPQHDAVSEKRPVFQANSSDFASRHLYATFPLVGKHTQTAGPVDSRRVQRLSPGYGQTVLPSIEVDHRGLKLESYGASGPSDTLRHELQHDPNMDGSVKERRQDKLFYLANSSTSHRRPTQLRPGTVLIPLGDDADNAIKEPSTMLNEMTQLDTGEPSFGSDDHRCEHRRQIMLQSGDRVLQPQYETHPFGTLVPTQSVISNSLPALPPKRRIFRLSNDQNGASGHVPDARLPQPSTSDRTLPAISDRMVTLGHTHHHGHNPQLDGNNQRQPGSFVATEEANTMERPPRLIRLGAQENYRPGSSQQPRSSTPEQDAASVSMPRQFFLSGKNHLRDRASEPTQTYNWSTNPGTQYQLVTGASSSFHETQLSMGASRGHIMQRPPASRTHEVVMLDD